MSLVFFQTFGCQMNVADSSELGILLAGRGYQQTESAESADLLIINTCSVREHAEQRAKARIRELIAKKEKHSKLWVIGCMAERLGDKLKDELPGVDLVIGARSLNDVDAILEKHVPSQLDQRYSGSIAAISEFVPVMRGCNNFCSYCIVPYVRGPEQSISRDDLIKKIESSASRGVKEISLLGQNVNSYNDNGTDFPDLLKTLCQIDGIERIRFTTSHPKDCTIKLIDTIASQPKLCKHIHLPVQAGSNRILNEMNRQYTKEHYLSIIQQIRSRIPDCDITTDIMVGFPSETDDEFLETLELVKEVRYTTAFMFAYSSREGTKAAHMSDSLTRDQKIARLNRLITLQTTITKEIYESMVQKELEVMVTGRQEKKDRLWIGTDKGFKRVLVSCNDASPGTILKVYITKSTGMTLVGERIL